MNAPKLLAVPVLVALLGAPAVPGQDCPYNQYVQVTDDFFLTASSDQGAVGDVVAVDIALTVEQLREGLRSFAIAGCYDAERAELLEPPLYSEAFDRLTYISWFFHIGGEGPGPQRPGGGRGFVITGSTREGAPEAILSPARPVPLATLFFRLRGTPGDSFEVRFCDAEFTFVDAGGGCVYSYLYYASRSVLDSLEARSTRHQAATIRILEGEPTRPDPPSLPPEARVYPEAPTPEDAGIRFELAGAVASPGDEVALPIFITSNYEFSGFSVALSFPPESLRLTRVEEHTRPGSVQFSNDMGALGIFMANSWRRVGREGERVHVATAHFTIREEARGEVELRFEPYWGFTNWVAIRHTGGLETGELPITAEVEPVIVTRGLIRVQNEATVPGDVNLDYQLNLTDAVSLLETLFRGARSVHCPQAADFNEDGAVNVSDPVAILNHLFRGDPGPSPRDVFCRSAS